MLAHLRNGDTYARLAAGFAIGTATAWRKHKRHSVILADAAGWCGPHPRCPSLAMT